ncbi:BON domain-containing protein [Saccharophagus degradans]|uniref:Transport-associated n=1 Tax=Saccharophagus degradans (strain 2-40 / ATCC 43961 / DSM 17024) TaxID=203122 RepID=Q21FX4_SACD2|nr:BON domain-containing protein [Saccharophagus degradans]ABD82405.1 transport-associated [Saccharophagus degradans 2-40]
MKTKTLLIVILSSLTLLGGCASVLDAVTPGPIKADPSKRSFGTYIDDQNIETIVQVNIRKAAPVAKEANIAVHSFNGAVLLIGQVPSAEIREVAGKTARNEPRVRQVYNELVVGEKTDFFDRTADNVLQTKINSKLALNRDIESSRVKVIVENDTAYLMGLLTRVQAEKITDVVSSTKGIKKVVRAIEYLED